MFASLVPSLESEKVDVLDQRKPYGRRTSLSSMEESLKDEELTRQHFVNDVPPMVLSTNSSFSISNQSLGTSSMDSRTSIQMDVPKYRLKEESIISPQANDPRSRKLRSTLTRRNSLTMIDQWKETNSMNLQSTKKVDVPRQRKWLIGDAEIGQKVKDVRRRSLLLIDQLRETNSIKLSPAAAETNHQSDNANHVWEDVTRPSYVVPTKPSAEAKSLHSRHIGSQSSPSLTVFDQ